MCFTRQCCVGTEMVDWQMQHSSCVHSRLQAVAMWQVLLEEGVLCHGETGLLILAICFASHPIIVIFTECDLVDREPSFQDKYIFYRFLDDEEEETSLPDEEERRQSQEELQDTLVLLSQMGPDAYMRMILRKR